MRYVYPKLKKIDSRDGECVCRIKLSDYARDMAERLDLPFGEYEDFTHTLTVEPLSAYGEAVYSNEQYAVSVTESTVTTVL